MAEFTVGLPVTVNSGVNGVFVAVGGRGVALLVGVRVEVRVAVGVDVLVV